jgi:hypothetical protein
MSLKLKALGLGFLAAIAVSAVVVMNVSASPIDPIKNPGESGHFVSDAPNKKTHVIGTEGPGLNHRGHLFDHSVAGEIGCDIASYTALATGETVVSLTVSAAYDDCYTTPEGAKDSVTVTMNGCTYTFTVKKETTNNTEQTVHLVCPAGKKVEVHHPNCTTSIHPQTVNTGFTYTKEFEGTKHVVTLDVKATFANTKHGLCQFVSPTNGFGEIRGSVTVRGFDAVTGAQASITAT